MSRAVPTQVVLLPGAVLPAGAAYPALLSELGPDVDARPKELELYAAGAPRAYWGLDAEVDGVLAAADRAGFDRFHLVGYSAGGSVGLLVAARQPERLLSLALLEPAWAGNRDLDPEEERHWRRLHEIMRLPPAELMAQFTRALLRPGVTPPPPPDGPPPPWMAHRPAGVAALDRAFAAHELDLEELRALDAPVLYVLGGLSNPEHFARQADRLAAVLLDLVVEVYDERHHFDPPHRSEPARLARTLAALWTRA